VLVNL